MLGVLAPLGMWWLAAVTRVRSTFLARFFAGFCLIANGAYLAFGSLNDIGDCGVMLNHGSAPWQLWLFGAATIPAGILLWHNQGAQFGFGLAQGRVDVRLAYISLLIVLLIVSVEFVFGSR